jgi:amyloid beta precursor protein binding protein 1
VLCSSILARTLLLFKQKFGTIPLSGVLPDMTSTTDNYMQLQELYTTQAHHDLQQFLGILHSVLQAHGLPANTIPDDEIDIFCKNGDHIQQVTTSSIASEINLSSEEIISYVQNTLQDDLYDDPAQVNALIQYHLLCPYYLFCC